MEQAGPGPSAKPRIARAWHGVTPASKGDAYAEFLRTKGTRDYLATPGNRGVQILRRTVGEREEFLLLSFWDSMEAVKGFAGPDPERAVYYPEDEGFLLEFEPSVVHYEVVELPRKTP